MSKKLGIQGSVLAVLLSLALALTGCFNLSVLLPSGSPVMTPRVMEIRPIPEETMSIATGTQTFRSGHFYTAGQEDGYEFIPTVSGFHRFEVSGMLSGSAVSMQVHNEIGHRIGRNTSARNGDGLSLDLVAGERYSVTIRQSDGLTGYEFLIGHKKPTVDVSSATIVSDRMQYNDQRNTYSFVPKVSGRHRFEMTDLPSGYAVGLYVYNEIDHRIAQSTSTRNGQGLSLNLVAGEKYTVLVRQESGLSSYNLNIGHKKAIVDLSSRGVISDSVQYTGQRNTYTFVPIMDGRHVFEISGLRSGSNVQMYLYNQGGQQIGRGNKISRDLIPREEYTLEVRQESGFSSYHLIIENPLGTNSTTTTTIIDPMELLLGGFQ